MTNQKGRMTKQDLLDRADQLLDALQRSRAELENTRRRFQLEKTQSAEAAQVAMIGDLLPLLDNLERAFGVVPEELRSNNWVKGVLQIRQQLEKYVVALELQPISAAGKEFDPTQMEAVGVVADKSKQSGAIAAEVLRGYIWRGQVLRPAQVKVVKND